MPFFLWLLPLLSFLNPTVIAVNHVKVNVTIDQLLLPFNTTEGSGSKIKCRSDATGACDDLHLEVKVLDTFNESTGYINSSFAEKTLSSFTLVSFHDSGISSVSVLKSNPPADRQLIFDFKGIYPGYLILHATLIYGGVMIDWWAANLTGPWNEEKNTTALGNYDLYPYARRNALVILHKAACAPTWFAADGKPKVCSRNCVDEIPLKVCDDFGVLRCAENRYGRNCRKRCTPQRNVEDGFYRCDSNGTQVCAKGQNMMIKCLEPFCDKDWCQNGGTCRVMKDQVKCFCTPGFSGERCMTESTCKSKTPKLWPTEKVEGQQSCMDTFSCACFLFKDDPKCHGIIRSTSKFREFFYHWGNFIALVTVTIIFCVALPLGMWILTIIGERLGYLE